MLFVLLGGRIDRPIVDASQPQNQPHPQAQPQTQGQNPIISEPNHQQQQNLGPQYQHQQQQQFQEQQQLWQYSNLAPQVYQFGHPEITFDEFDPASISAMELWNRFQSFYEPTPVAWGAGLGGEIAQSQPGVGGSVYDGMVMGGLAQQE